MRTPFQEIRLTIMDDATNKIKPAKYVDVVVLNVWRMHKSSLLGLIPHPIFWTWWHCLPQCWMVQTALIPFHSVNWYRLSPQFLPWCWLAQADHLVPPTVLNGAGWAFSSLTMLNGAGWAISSFHSAEWCRLNPQFLSQCWVVQTEP